MELVAIVAKETSITRINQTDQPAVNDWPSQVRSWLLGLRRELANILKIERELFRSFPQVPGSVPHSNAIQQLSLAVQGMEIFLNRLPHDIRPNGECVFLIVEPIPLANATQYQTMCYWLRRTAFFELAQICHPGNGKSKVTSIPKLLIKKIESAVKALSFAGPLQPGEWDPSAIFKAVDRSFQQGESLAGNASEAATELLSAEQATNGTKSKKRHRKPANNSPKPLTDRQVEAFRLFGELNGNMSEVAKRMGIARQSAKQHYAAANKKIGRTAMP